MLYYARLHGHKKQRADASTTRKPAREYFVALSCGARYPGRMTTKARIGRPPKDNPVRRFPMIGIRTPAAFKDAFREHAAALGLSLQGAAFEALEQHMHPSAGAVAHNWLEQAIHDAELGAVGELVLERLSKAPPSALALALLGCVGLDGVGDYALEQITSRINAGATK